ncbi:hypothetical protein MTP99_005956 [Tenebrio molitor]|nr:hypothetical protein MTP99_005956 [Tenebrio molitor]
MALGANFNIFENGERVKNSILACHDKPVVFPDKLEEYRVHGFTPRRRCSSAFPMSLLIFRSKGWSAHSLVSKGCCNPTPCYSWTATKRIRKSRSFRSSHTQEYAIV